MKFLVALAAFAAGAAASGAAAAATGSTSECLADYIVTTCLGTENDKLDACAATDYDCLCAAKEAIATCYNNCPNDPRANSAKQEVGIFCANASLYGSKAQAAAKTPDASAPATGGSSPATAAATPTSSSGTAAAASTSGQTSKATSSSAAGAVNANGAVFAGFAGLLAAML